MKNIVKIFVPMLLLFSLLGLLAHELFYAKPNIIPSALIGEKIPSFRLPSLWANNKSFTPKDLQGKVSLLNVWASWCYACSLEHAMLMEIKEKYHVPIFSINYKDNPIDAQNWLNKSGDPYIITGIDKNGDAAIDLGIYGTPETFVISPQGKIVYRHVGVIDQKTWDEVLYPLIRQYQQPSRQ